MIYLIGRSETPLARAIVSTACNRRVNGLTGNNVPAVHATANTFLTLCSVALKPTGKSITL